MMEEDEGIQEAVEAKATRKEGEKYLHTFLEKGTCYFPMLDIASYPSSQEF